MLQSNLLSGTEMKPLSGTYILVSNETKWLRKGFNPKTPVLSAHLYCIGKKYFNFLFTYIPGSILILSKFLFTNLYTSKLS
jgi:hypothetical protein